MLLEVNTGRREERGNVNFNYWIYLIVNSYYAKKIIMKKKRLHYLMQWSLLC